MVPLRNKQVKSYCNPLFLLSALSSFLCLMMHIQLEIISCVCIYIDTHFPVASLVAQLVKNPPAMKETWIYIYTPPCLSKLSTPTKLSNDSRTLFCGSSKYLGKTLIPFSLVSLSLVSDETSY